MASLLDRPEGFHGALDHQLSRIQDGLLRFLVRGQRNFARDRLSLPKPALKALAGVLVGFAEDLHAGIGLWHSLERFNKEFFGPPLPFLIEPGAALPPEAISPARVQHLLWILY